MKVLNFGSLNLDYVYHVDHFVCPGETLSSTSMQINSGGKGLNQSIALAKAGAAVYHAGCIGIGGEKLQRLLQESGVNTELLRSVDVPQGNAVIQVTTTGDNCILLFGGSNQCITEAQITETLDMFTSEDYLVLQNEINMLPQIINKAYEKGMKIVLNPSPYDQKLADVDYQKITWLFVNEVEAAQISGSEDPEKAWEILHLWYPKLSVLITMGGAGSVAYCVRGDNVETVRLGTIAVDVADTTAAGDTYTGYFLCSLMENAPLNVCMERASMAAAISVTRLGAAKSIPDRQEVREALLECGKVL